MRAEVVYESMHGSTHQVAHAIGTGLGPAFDASVAPYQMPSVPGRRDLLPWPPGPGPASVGPWA